MSNSNGNDWQPRRPKKSQRIIAMVVVLAMIFTTFIAALAVAFGS
ncbi:MAG: hypothetical protein PT944_00585 [Actinomycetaceae bacterium]|nr:hypothetical protein [Actinomycetaceae bacterium]MDY5272683.1 hypothetical protein [Arcanobacterium sp.]